MRNIALILLLVSASAHAHTICKDELAKCMAGQACRWNESRDCDRVAWPRGLQVDEASWQDVEEPDTTKPLLKSQLRDCVNAEDCQVVIEAMTCSKPEIAPVYRDKGDGGMEAYCPEPQMKTVKKLRPDAAKIAAKQALADVEAAKEIAVDDARSRLRQAVQNWDQLTAAQQKEVLRAIIRLIIRE